MASKERPTGASSASRSRENNREQAMMYEVSTLHFNFELYRRRQTVGLGYEESGASYRCLEENQVVPRVLVCSYSVKANADDTDEEEEQATLLATAWFFFCFWPDRGKVHVFSFRLLFDLESSTAYHSASCKHE